MSDIPSSIPEEVTEVVPEVVPVPVPVVPEVVPVPVPVVPEVVPVPVPVVPEVIPVPVPVVPEVVVPKDKAELDTAAILVQVSRQLKSFLAGGKLTLANMTGVVIDLYNFIQSYKSLTESQKIRMIVTVLTDFINSEVDGDPTLIAVVDSLVPRIVETLVGVSNGSINIGEIFEEVEEKVKGCFSCCKRKN
jgi:hypothetical protein